MKPTVRHRKQTCGCVDELQMYFRLGQFRLRVVEQNEIDLWSESTEYSHRTAHKLAILVTSVKQIRTYLIIVQAQSLVPCQPRRLGKPKRA